MWRHVRVLCFLVGIPLSAATSAAHLSLKVSKESTDATSLTDSNSSSTSPGTVSAAPTDGSLSTSAFVNSDTLTASNSSVWHMKPVTSIQARVQGDAPVWNKDAKMWLSMYGKTLNETYESSLDTANTATVEGVLMYVQAEGINVNEHSVKCERKNKMQYIVFYEITIVQPSYGIKFYEKHNPPEYGEFVAMDGGKCTDVGDALSEDCKVYYGLDDAMHIGPMVGCGLQTLDPRAPYPGNYWFSYPGACAQELREDKTEESRALYPSGLCAMGKEPDGETCSFSYKILGYLDLDNLVGITQLGYKNYTDFCQDGGIEFKAKNTGSGFNVEESIDFWKNPGDQEANANRTSAMVKMYNDLVISGNNSNMEPLPDIKDLTSTNPNCYENSEACATTSYGCNRTLYSQICTVCMSNVEGCVAAPTSFSFPKLTAVRPASSDSSLNSTETSDSSQLSCLMPMLVGIVAAFVGGVL